MTKNVSKKNPIAFLNHEGRNMDSRDPNREELMPHGGGVGGESETRTQLN